MGPPPPSYGSAPPMSGHMGPPPPHGGGPASHQGHSGQGGHNYGYGGPPPYEAPPLPHDASPTLYVEGLPADATEREVAHIFRRFEGQGYQSIRMFPKEGKNGSQLFLCFVEFDHPHAANHAMQTTQGYRFDRKSEASALKISFSRPKGAPRAATGGPPPQRRNSSGGAEGYSPSGPPLRGPPPPLGPPGNGNGHGAARGGGGGGRDNGGRDNGAYDGGRHDGRQPMSGAASPRGHRRDGREHRDDYEGGSYRDDESELGADELGRHAQDSGGLIEGMGQD